MQPEGRAPSEAVVVRGGRPGSLLELTIRAERASLEGARRAVLDFLAPLALSPRVRFRIELVLEETLMNLVLHAFDDEARHAIELEVRVDPDDIVLCFEDDGAPFDPRAVGERVAPTSIAEAVPGGLGLGLVRRSARSIAYERQRGRNQLTIAVAR